MNPGRDLKRTNLNLDDTACAVYWPQKLLLAEVRLWYSGAQGQIQTVQTVEVQPQSPCCNSSTSNSNSCGLMVLQDIRKVTLHLGIF